MLKTTYKSLQHNCVFEILVVEISKFNCNCNQFIRFLFAYLGKISVKGIAQNLLVRPGKNKYPINGLLPLSNKFLASKLTKFQFQIFIHLIPVTIYIFQVFKISLSNVSKFRFFCKPFKLYMYIWSTKIVWRIFLSLLMECIVHNILLILIMRIHANFTFIIFEYQCKFNLSISHLQVCK